MILIITIFYGRGQHGKQRAAYRTGIQTRSCTPQTYTGAHVTKGEGKEEEGKRGPSKELVSFFVKIHL